MLFLSCAHGWRKHGKVIDISRVLEFFERPEEVVVDADRRCDDAFGGVGGFWAKLSPGAVHLHAVLIF